MFSVIKTTSMDKEGSLCLPIQNSGEGFLHIFLSYVIHCLFLMSNGKDFCFSIFVLLMIVLSGTKIWIQNSVIIMK